RGEGVREVGRCRLGERLDEEDAGVVHEHVGHAELFFHARHRALDVGGFRDVTGDIGTALGRGVRQAARHTHDMHPRGSERIGDREPDPPGGARHERDLHSEKLPPCTSLRNSSRVLASSRNAPRSALVTVFEFCFSTPRIIMQRWYASITTPTPSGVSTRQSASATWSVSRSCTWSRRTNTSTTRGIFESPTMRPLGRYATCARPKNGSI